MLLYMYIQVQQMLSHSWCRCNVLRLWRLLFSNILSTNCWPKSILNTSEQWISWMKAAFTARVNLLTQVMEVAYFSCWSRKSRKLRQKPTKKLLACSALKFTSKHLNKVIRVNSCVYFLFFHIYFLFLWASAWITNCVFFETTYLILVTLQVVTGVRSVPSRGKFYPGYRLLWRTREKCKGAGGGWRRIKSKRQWTGHLHCKSK